MLIEFRDLLKRLNLYAEIALEQAENQARYGVPNPGGRGRQLYPVAHPLFPYSERVDYPETFPVGVQFATARAEYKEYKRLANEEVRRWRERADAYKQELATLKEGIS